MEKKSPSICRSQPEFGPASFSNSTRQNWIAGLGLIFLILFIYSNNYSGSWHFDDYPIITDNNRIHIETLDFEAIWRSFFAHPNGERLYRPIPMFSFALNWVVGQDHTWGYHCINNVIHVLTAYFLFLTIQLLFQSPVAREKNTANSFPIAFLSAVLWAVHPIQVQAVTYIVQRMASMAAMFYILSLLFFIKSRLERKTAKKVVFAFSCFLSLILSILSKENAVLLPVSILLVELVFFKGLKNQFKSIIENNAKTTLYVLLFFAFLVVVVVSYFLYQPVSQMITGSYSQRPFTMLERVLTEPRVLVFYLSLIFYPIPNRFSINHLITKSTSFVDPVTTPICFFIVVGLVIFAVVQMKRRPFLSFAILFYFINHLVESSFLGLELVYEHRNYLPTMFLFLPISMFFYEGRRLYPKINSTLISSLCLSGVVVIVVLGIATHIRNMDWRTEKTLWESVLRLYPKSTRALHNLAYGYYSKKGDYNTALKLYSKALSLDWRDNSAVYRKGITYNNIAGILYAFGKDEKAIQVWNKAIEIYPSNKTAILGKTQALISTGRYNDALTSLGTIPENQRNIRWINLEAFIYYKLGGYGKSLSLSQRAISLHPLDVDSLTLLGAIYKKLEYYEKSKFFLQLAYSQSKKLEILLLLLENSIILNDEANRDKLLKRIVMIDNKKKVLSALKKSMRSESISLELNRVVPYLLQENNSVNSKWNNSVNMLLKKQA